MKQLKSKNRFKISSKMWDEEFVLPADSWKNGSEATSPNIR